MSVDTLADLLDVLATLDEGVLLGIYGIERDSGAPLDVALFAWRDAGRPGHAADALASLDALTIALDGSLTLEFGVDGHLVSLDYNITGEPETARGTGATRAEAAAACLAACPKPAGWAPVADNVHAERDAYRAFAVRLAAFVATPGAEDHAEKTTPADLGTLAEVVEGEYGRGRTAGDAARFERCKVDVARALGLDARRVPTWDALVESVRAAALPGVEGARAALAEDRDANASTASKGSGDKLRAWPTVTHPDTGEVFHLRRELHGSGVVLDGEDDGALDAAGETGGAR